MGKVGHVPALCYSTIYLICRRCKGDKIKRDARA